MFMFPILVYILLSGILFWWQLVYFSKIMNSYMHICLRLVSGYQLFVSEIRNILAMTSCMPNSLSALNQSSYSIYFFRVGTLEKPWKGTCHCSYWSCFSSCSSCSWWANSQGKMFYLFSLVRMVLSYYLMLRYFCHSVQA